MSKIIKYRVKNIKDIAVVMCKLDIKWEFAYWVKTAGEKSFWP